MRKRKIGKQTIGQLVKGEIHGGGLGMDRGGLVGRESTEKVGRAKAFPWGHRPAQSHPKQTKGKDTSQNTQTQAEPRDGLASSSSNVSGE